MSISIEDLKEMLDAAEKERGDIDKVLQAIKRVKLEQKKRLYAQAKRARKKTSGTPMAERADLKSVQCGFESRAEDVVE